MTTWKTKDGAIHYDEQLKTFTWIGESANIAMHKKNELRRKFMQTIDESDEVFIQSLNKKLVKTQLTPKA